MKFNKSICSVVSGIMAASMLCLPAYAAEDNNTKIPSLEEVMSVEQASVKVEDGVIAYVPDKTQEDSFSESNKQIPVKPAYYPYEIQYEDHHGKPVIIKSFRVPAEYNPHELVEESFEEDGYRYIQQDILMDAPVKFFEEKVVAEPITFSTKDNKAETLKAALEPVLEYNEGGFQGQLTIDYDSIVSMPADESTYSVNLFLVNKTDKNIMFNVEDASVNGFMANPFCAESVYAGRCAFSSMSWYNKTLEENGIKEVETIEFRLKASDKDVVSGDDFANGMITLNP